MPEDILFGVAQANTSTLSAPEYVIGLQSRLKKTFEAARQNIQMSQHRQKLNYDTRSPIKEHRFDVGDIVYLKNMSTIVGVSKKLQPIMKGPFIVTKVISPLLYKISDRTHEYVKHHDMIKLCEDRNIPLWVLRKRQQVLDPNNTRVEEVPEEPEDIIMDSDIITENEDVQVVVRPDHHHVPVFEQRTRYGRTVHRPDRYTIEHF